MLRKIYQSLKSWNQRCPGIQYQQAGLTEALIVPIDSILIADSIRVSLGCGRNETGIHKEGHV